MAGFVENMTGYLNAMLSQLFTKLVVAVVIILIGFIIGRIVGRLVHKFLQEIELNNILKKAGIKIELESLLSHFATYFVYFVTIIWALNTLGLTTTILNMISAAFLILIIISILLAIKDVAPNMISGFFIYHKEIVKVGDVIKVDTLEGTVEKISLVETELKTSSGDVIHIPNSILTKKAIIVKKNKN